MRRAINQGLRPDPPTESDTSAGHALPLLLFLCLDLVSSSGAGARTLIVHPKITRLFAALSEMFQP